MSGLPGFWLDKSECAQLWLEKDHSCPMMLIPYRAPDGLVQACQIRFMCRKLSGDSVRYVWLSTPEKSRGVGCGSPLHFASYNASPPSRPVLITEDALKAETARVFCGSFDVLASAGVICSHEDMIAAVSPFRPILIAFDADHYENPYVARTLAKLLNSFFDTNKAYFYNRIKIVTWNRKHKGIDDALLKNIPLAHLPVSDWYKSISEKCQNEIKQMLPKPNLFAV